MWKPIIQRAFRIRRHYILSLDNPQYIKDDARNADFVIEHITSDNVHRVAEFRSQKQAETFHRFLQQGQVGIYALLNSKVVGHAWAYICRQSHCRVNGYMDIRQGEAFIHYCNVSENQRGQNIFPTMLVALCHRLFSQEGISRVLIDTESDNIASLRAHLKVGFEPRGVGTYIQLGGRLLFKRFTSLNNVPATEARKRLVKNGKSGL